MRERSSVGVKKRKITGESQQMCERKRRVRERISQREKDRERDSPGKLVSEWCLG